MEGDERRIWRKHATSSIISEITITPIEVSEASGEAHGVTFAKQTRVSVIPLFPCSNKETKYRFMGINSEKHVMLPPKV